MLLTMIPILLLGCWLVEGVIEESSEEPMLAR
jgi:hypothetical protein